MADSVQRVAPDGTAETNWAFRSGLPSIKGAAGSGRVQVIYHFPLPVQPGADGSPAAPRKEKAMNSDKYELAVTLLGLAWRDDELKYGGWRLFDCRVNPKARYILTQERAPAPVVDISTIEGQRTWREYIEQDSERRTQTFEGSKLTEALKAFIEAIQAGEGDD